MNLAQVLPFLLTSMSFGGAAAAAGNLRGLAVADQGCHTEPEDLCKSGIDASLSCRVYARGPNGVVFGGQDCDTFSTPKLGRQCDATPTGVKLRFNGGGCGGTNSELGIKCSGQGTPPLAWGNNGKQYWVAIYDPEGGTLGVYRSLFAHVGDTFVFGNEGEPMSNGFVLEVYNDASDRRELIQEIIYPSGLCFNQGNKLGAFEVVDFDSPSGGTGGGGDSPPDTDNQIVNTDFEVKLDVTFSLAQGTPLQSFAMKQAAVLTDFAGTIDMTSMVKGKVLGPRNTLTATIPVDIKDMLAHKQDFNVHTILVGSGSGIQGSCATTRSLTYLSKGAF